MMVWLAEVLQEGVCAFGHFSELGFGGKWLVRFGKLGASCRVWVSALKITSGYELFGGLSASGSSRVGPWEARLQIQMGGFRKEGTPKQRTPNIVGSLL